MFAGFSTGRADVLDLGEPLNVPVNPGGFAFYRNGRVVGGIGVSGLDPDQAEYVAFVGAASTPGLAPLPSNPLPVPGAVFIDGLRSAVLRQLHQRGVRRGVDSRRRPVPPACLLGADIRVQPRAGRAVATDT